MTTTNQTIERGTLYWGRLLNYHKIEAKNITLHVTPNEIKITLIEKGCRKESEMSLDGGRLVILSGWGHPSPPSLYHPAQDVGKDPVFVVNLNFCRYVAGDVRWNQEFDIFLDEHLKESGSEIVADFRDHGFPASPNFTTLDLTERSHVVVWGVTGGQIISLDHLERENILKQEFNNLSEAQAVFSELSLQPPENTRFVGPAVQWRHGRPSMRIDTCEFWKSLNGNDSRTTE
jgi:hypothetical protein